MTILINIGIFFLNLIYFFIKLIPVSNKITFISRQKNVPSVDFILLKQEINRRNKDLKVVFLCRRLEKNISGYISYAVHMLRQMYHIATSKVVVLDTYCISISVLKHKKQLCIIQMWHAMGAYKKFGYSILNKKEGSNAKLARLMKMHKNYDYVFASSEESSIHFAEAFNVDMDKMRIMPLPRIDLLNSKKNLNKTRKNIVDKYPELENKKNILYAPTFRKNYNSRQDIYNLINSVNYDKYNLIIKFHPLSNINIDDSRVLIDKDFTSLEMGFVSDYIITDYSAVVFELALLYKPLFFYTYDLETYIDNRDFYLDYKKEMPGLISKDPKTIIKCIEQDDYDLSKIKQFNKRYVSIPKEGCTKAIVNFIFDKLD